VPWSIRATSATAPSSPTSRNPPSRSKYANSKTNSAPASSTGWGRSVRLTELGKTLLPRARTVLRELEAARGDVAEHKDSIGGSLRLGVIPTVAPYILPAQLTAFARKFPQAHLSVVEEITPSSLNTFAPAT
jgi:hypothetical protein